VVSPRRTIGAMSAFSTELAVVVAVLLAVAVAAGTLCARLFVAASRPRPGGGGADEET